MTWRDSAACLGSTVDFFDHDQTNQALTICHGCTVVDDCLAEALSSGGTDDHGVWGGRTKEERIRMRPKYRRPAQQPCGTYAGYNRHYRHKTPVCEPCRIAKLAYQQGRVRRRGRAA